MLCRLLLLTIPCTSPVFSIPADFSDKHFMLRFAYLCHNLCLCIAFLTGCHLRKHVSDQPRIRHRCILHIQQHSTTKLCAHGPGWESGKHRSDALFLFACTSDMRYEVLQLLQSNSSCPLTLLATKLGLPAVVPVHMVQHLGKLYLMQQSSRQHCKLSVIILAVLWCVTVALYDE